MHNKISHMEEKCHHEKLKQQTIKCLNCFPNSKIVQPFFHFLRQGIWKPILCGQQTFILGKFSQGLGSGYCVPPQYLCCILLQTHSINMHEIYGSICELNFLARPQGCCALKEKNCK